VEVVTGRSSTDVTDHAIELDTLIHIDASHALEGVGMSPSMIAIACIESLT
jgi:hypothetical protein